jgi:hypothetical protein
MSLCIVTAYTPTPGWKELGEFTVLSMKEYADRHGLHLKVFTDGFNRTRAFQWSKIQFIRRVLPDYDWVWWLDADAIITNHKNTYSKFLLQDADIVIGNQPETDSFCNTGSFFIRNCPFSFWLLDEIWKRDDLANKTFYEQTALSNLYEKGMCKNRVKLIPFRQINSFCDAYAERLGGAIPDEKLQWHVGDFVAHCCGYSVSHRLEILREFWKFTIR